ncbi:Uncharacterized protein dnm_036250 [Desulfonema magnum]|uniref:Uncharacterized protein n=1 Tax=Desulfonema magnum TaxID=45655 RepID=A0A975BLH5_9BACT|nr:Uncharacterized protein dnm_036250 [Desulfonema magnum]
MDGCKKPLRSIFALLFILSILIRLDFSGWTDAKNRFALFLHSFLSFLF